MNKLKPLTKPITVYHLGSFDIETYGHENKFYMGSVWHDGKFKKSSLSFKENASTHKVFYDKYEMIAYMNKNCFANNFIWTATNLEFDLLSLFKDTQEFMKLRFLWRGSRLILGKYLLDKQKRRNVKYYDTLNHLKLSVSDLGTKVLNLPKLEQPCFLGKKPKDRAEVKILEEYNLRDSEITYLFSKFIQSAYNEIGCSFRCTLPSSSMDLFKRKYLKGEIYTPPENVIKYLKNGYYGGRTEVLKRGKIENAVLYDINSLYPTVMSLYKFPNPNKFYYNEHKCFNDYQIKKYEGVSDVTLYCPYMDKPYLPVRHNDKLLFPIGVIKGFYTHFEIREAIKLGYKLIETRSSLSYPHSDVYFKDFVSDMYNNRMKYKLNGNPMEIVFKILLNSLYGKFAQSIEPHEEVRHVDTYSKEEFINLFNGVDKVKVINDFVYLKGNKTHIPAYINPILSIYVTAYSRDFLYKSLPKDVYYMDTDSCITKEKLETGFMLGEWKAEAIIKKGYLIKPKFYYYENDDGDNIVKVKGCGKIGMEGFNDLLKGDVYTYEKFTKFKESIRRKFSFNTIINVSKHLDLEDNKREWTQKFNPEKTENSMPIKLTLEDY